MRWRERVTAPRHLCFILFYFKNLILLQHAKYKWSTTAVCEQHFRDQRSFFTVKACDAWHNANVRSEMVSFAATAATSKTAAFC